MITLQVKVTSAGLIKFTPAQLRKLMRQVGNQVAASARSKIRKAVGGGRVYYTEGSAGSGKRYQASQPGQAPGSVSGNLAASIKVYPYKSGEGVAVRSRMFYALFLEQGAQGGGGGKGNRNKRGKASTTRRLLPRPFLSTALAEQASGLGKRIFDAVVNDIAFKQTKK